MAAFNVLWMYNSVYGRMFNFNFHVVIAASKYSLKLRHSLYNKCSVIWILQSYIWVFVMFALVCTTIIIIIFQCWKSVMYCTWRSVSILSYLMHHELVGPVFCFLFYRIALGIFLEIFTLKLFSGQWVFPDCHPAVIIYAYVQFAYNELQVAWDRTH